MPSPLFDLAPALPLPALVALAVLIAIAVLYGAIRGARGLLWRGLAILALLGWMAGPRALHPVRRPVPQDALLVVDRSPSMRVGDRAREAERIAAALQRDAARLPGLTLHRIDVTDTTGGHGTRLFEAMDRADLPQGRFAGAIVVSDGMDHDAPARLPARFHTPEGGTLPLHLLLTAKGEETDRRIQVLSTPPFAIVGQNATIRVRVDDLGVPGPGVPQQGAEAVLTVRSGDAPPSQRPIRIGEATDITLPIQHPGETLVGLSASPLAGEVSELNNSAVIRIRAVRDRLRVLLVSGVPNQSERVWRRLLKADPSVDLVHFTILRSPNTDDGTPLSDLALIPFPIRELFQEKIRSFDLIILDGFRNSNILPEAYLTNIANYVRQGGGLLVTAGPEFVREGSLQDTTLSGVFPAHVPSDGIVTGPFRPALTALGRQHPVTAGLEDGEWGNQGWGPWYRSAKADQSHGEALMSGPDGAPLLLLDRVEDGRVAMLLSDQLWLWSRGEGGGGPQAELLRRLSHWLMKEPDLEENRLLARIEDGRLLAERHAMGDTPVSAQAIVTTPEGRRVPVAMTKAGDMWRGALPVTGSGIWTVRQDGLLAFASPAPPDALELADLRATATVMGGLARGSGGSVLWAADSTPELRHVPAGETLSGGGWIGLPVTTAVVPGETRARDLVPGWLALLLALGFLGIGWWREGR